MERRVFFLFLLSFLVFAEGLSWMMAGGLGPCLIEPEHSQQAANDNEYHDCPTLFAGSLLSLERGFDWVKHDDNDKGVVAAFTVVLAISTIGLWLATINLWKAGERQLELLSETAADQSRNMRDSMAIADRSAQAAEIAARAAEKSADALLIVERPYIFIWGMIGSAPTITFSSSTEDTPPTILQEEAYFTYSVSNRGKLAAVIENVSIACGYEYREMYPPLIGMGDHYLLQMPLISSEQDVKSIPHRRLWTQMHPTERAAGFRDGLIFRVVVSYRGPFTKCPSENKLSPVNHL